jgi:hypothetical protein
LGAIRVAPRWLAAWRRKPLIVRGARQVGKTWLVEHVAAAGFETMVKVDLKKRRDLHVHFGDNLDPKAIVRPNSPDPEPRDLPPRHRQPILTIDLVSYWCGSTAQAGRACRVWRIAGSER